MIVLDVSTLVASLRDDHGHHIPVRAWLDDMVGGEEPFVIPGLVAVGMVRIVTNPRAFPVATPFRVAFDFLDALMDQRAYSEGAHDATVHELFRSLCLTGQVGGNLVTDAWIAACALSMRASVATMDRDFRRFDGLRIIDPGATMPA